MGGRKPDYKTGKRRKIRELLTTNLPMGRWYEMFTGRIAATAILDRLFITAMC